MSIESGFFRIDRQNADHYRVLLSACSDLCLRSGCPTDSAWFFTSTDRELYGSEMAGGQMDVTHLAIGGGEQVLAYCCLMPTIQSDAAVSTFATRLGIHSYPQGPGVYVMSPILFEPQLAEYSDCMDLQTKMIDEIVGFCQTRHIWNLVFVAEARWLTWYLNTGFDVYPLGLPMRMEDKTFVGLRLRVPGRKEIGLLH